MKSQITIRPATMADAADVSRIVFEAFCGIARDHNFPADFPSLESAAGFAEMFIQHPAIYGVVAERDGRIIGSNFLDERDAIRGVGPITVDRDAQGKGAGRALMQAVLDRGTGAAGIRLLQDAFNMVSMSLYASLGFDIREPIAQMVGRPTGIASGRAETRLLSDADLPACGELCRRVHGHDRNGELRDAIKQFQPIGIFRSGRLTGYMSAPSLWPLNHGVAEDEQDMTDLILAAGAALPEPLNVLIPTRQASLFRWCLKSGMRIIKPLSLMTIGDYQEPRAAYFTSVLY